MGYTDYDYSFLYKDYKGENGPNWQRDIKQQLRFVQQMIGEHILIYDDEAEMFIWSRSKKPIYPELIPLVHIAYAKQGNDAFFKDKDALKKQYTQSFQVSTRHKDEFNTGFLGDLLSDNVFWRRQSAAKVFEMVQSFYMAKVFFENGVAKWSSNNNVIPRDCYEPLAYSNVLSKVYLSKNTDARREETNQLIKEYRKKQKGYKPSAEERAEMQAAFGKGTTVVDVITGDKYRI